MRNNQTIENKLSYLHNELYKIEDLNCRKQKEFLLDEIDYWKTELLKLKTTERIKEIDNEADKS
jgi:hypothetical protein